MNDENVDIGDDITKIQEDIVIMKSALVSIYKKIDIVVSAMNTSIAGFDECILLHNQQIRGMGTDIRKLESLIFMKKAENKEFIDPSVG